MVAPILADMFIKGATSVSQVAATGKSTTDKAFQKIFDTTMQNSNKAIQNTNETNEARRNESETAKATPEETDATRERTEGQKAASDKVENKDKESEAQDSKKADEETVVKKVDKLKKSNPKAYKDMIANLDNMTLGNLLSALGLNAADMNGLKPGVDLAGSVPEDLKQALKSEDSMAIGSALGALGIGDAGPGTAVSAFAGQANMAIAGTKGDAAGTSAANMKSDLQAATGEAAKDSSAAPAGEASSKEVSLDNSKSQTASSSSDSGSQSGSTNADGNSGQAFNPNFPAASATSVPNHGFKPITSAVDPFQLADNASPAANASAKADGAPQQAAAKPAITTQNLTSETDTAAALNTQTTKSSQAQPQSEARPANPSRQTFERMVLDQVVDKARLVVRPNGSSSMVIKLDPPTLGRLDMRVEVKEGVVRAAIVAENHDVRKAIEGNIENLKQSLHTNGLKVDEISVTVGGENGFQFKNDGMAQNAGSQNHGDGRRAHHGQTASAPAMAVDDFAPSRARAYAHSGVLNVVA